MSIIDDLIGLQEEAEELHKLVVQIRERIHRMLYQEWCKWTHDDERCWKTECGAAICFKDGGPAENRQKYCYHCGRIIEVVPAREEDVDNDCD